MSARLTVVGIGPGAPECITPQAMAALEDARVIVGYKLYLDLLPSALFESREKISTGMMGEVERCAKALELARGGERVAVVSSGDAGVYGMAGLVLELAETGAAAGGVDIEVVPGVPAVMAASALLGAPLTHDFACVSLSDLLTPWEAIEQRLDAAARADFVLAIYNPKSRRRDWQLGKALEIIGNHRKPDTPIGLVRQAYRDEQSVTTHLLKDFDPALVDMLSIVIVGNSATRLCAEPGRMFTPRGYGDKYDLGASQKQEK